MFIFLVLVTLVFFFFFSSRRRHTRWNCDWSSDVCSSDLMSTKQTVNVFHPSFQDFLCNATRAAIPGSFPVLEMESAHAEMTILCLQYLEIGRASCRERV